MATGYRWASDHALLVTFGDEASETSRRLVLGAIGILSDAPIRGMRNLHPAYASVLVVSDPRIVAAPAFESEVRHALAPLSGTAPAAPRRVDVPVCYAAPHAPDLDAVANAHALAPEEVIRLHAAAEYVVAFLGFVPGFPYLSGLPKALATPRLAVPRKKVPAGSVAIGGSQAGIYPFATPGGWRIIGRTPLELFSPDRDPPALLSPGDAVRFVPITAEAFESASRSRP